MSSTTDRSQFWFRRFQLHPFFFAVYPILALLAVNISQLDLSFSFRPLLLSVFVTGLVLLIFQFLSRDWQRAALLTTLFLILFFSYGHVYNLLKGIQLDSIFLFRHRTLIPIWFGLAALGIRWVLRSSTNIAAFTYALNLVGLFLLVLPLVQIVSFFFQRS